MNVEFLSLAIENADIDVERRIVRGVFISEEPNNLDEIFDYASSKPHVSKWSRHFEAATNGKSRGNVRLMHGKTSKGVELVGTVVEIEFNDKAKTISGAVHVSDDDTWKKVLDRVLTGFSFGGDSKGQPWRDKIASAKYGRPMKRYTFVPRELTLCDRGRIPGTEFTSIENADIQTGIQGETMADETNPIEAPEVVAPVVDPAPAADAPVVDAPAPDAGSQVVENGVSMANQFGSIVEALAYLVKCAEGEEKAEGENSTTPAELRDAVKGLIEPVKKYQAAQLDELLPEEEMTPTAFDIEDDDEFSDVMEMADDDGAPIENGDYPGHPFRGNQHAGGHGGAKGSAAHKASGTASMKAHRASVAAHSGQSGAHHGKAARAHAEAAKAAKGAGRNKVAKYHAAQAAHHRSMKKIQTKENSDVVVEPEVVTPVVIENADAKPDALAAALARIEALEAKQVELTTKIENADTAAPVRNRPVLPGSVVLRDPVIENADTELDAEVERLAKMPTDQARHELIRRALTHSAAQ